MTTHPLSGPAALFGRFLLAAVWLPSGLSKIGNFAGTAQFMAGAGMPAPQLMLAAAIVIEVVGALMLLAGWRTRWAAGALIAFMVLATAFFHNPWGVPPEQFQEQMIHMSKNNAITGALLLLLVLGPGPWSLDARRRGSATPIAGTVPLSGAAPGVGSATTR